MLFSYLDLLSNENLKKPKKRKGIVAVMDGLLDDLLEHNLRRLRSGLCHT
jgi:hypothetical protein